MADAVIKADLGYNNVRAIDHVDCAKKEQL